jgi:hypothetical protein
VKMLVEEKKVNCINPLHGRKSLEAMRDAGTGSGFILSTGHQCPRDTPDGILGQSKPRPARVNGGRSAPNDYLFGRVVVQGLEPFERVLASAS